HRRRLTASFRLQQPLPLRVELRAPQRTLHALLLPDSCPMHVPLRSAQCVLGERHVRVEATKRQYAALRGLQQHLPKVRSGVGAHRHGNNSACAAQMQCGVVTATESKELGNKTRGGKK
ncbi:hypothetical protein TraAM80_03510, partial [Trypanosoma rangeli]